MPKNPSHVTLFGVDSPLIRPSVGRRIALELRPARPLTWLGPIAATICGALAAAGPVVARETLLRVAIAVLLTDPILGAWRAAWVGTDWRRPIQGWRATPSRAWMLVPYARLESPAARFSQWLSSRARFWREAIAPQVGSSISAILVSALIAASVALVLGTTTFILTLVALLLAPIESELGTNGAGRWARAVGEVAMAWLIGNAAISLAMPQLDSALFAMLFAVVYRGLLSVTAHPEVGFTFTNGGQFLIALLLVFEGALIHAALVGLVLGAQVLWQAVARRHVDSGSLFIARIQWFVLGAMVVAALGIPHL